MFKKFVYSKFIIHNKRECKAYLRRNLQLLGLVRTVRELVIRTLERHSELGRIHHLQMTRMEY